MPPKAVKIFHRPQKFSGFKMGDSGGLKHHLYNLPYSIHCILNEILYMEYFCAYIVLRIPTAGVY